MAAFCGVLLVKNARGAGDLVDPDQPNSPRGRVHHRGDGEPYPLLERVRFEAAGKESVGR